MSLMAALAFLGFFFYEWTEIEESTSVSFANASDQIEIDADPILNLALESAIVGVRKGFEDSALGGNKHSLLAAQGFRIDGDLRPRDGLQPHAGDGVQIVPRYTAPASPPAPTPPTGTVPLGVLDGDPDGDPTMDGRPDNGIPDEIEFITRDGTTRPRGGALSNFRSGAGFTRRFVRDTYPDAPPADEQIVMNYSRVAWGDATGTESPFTQPNASGLADFVPGAGYTYPDINSMFLAHDSYIEPFGGVNPAAGAGTYDGSRYRVIIPSFFRPQYFPLRRDTDGTDSANGAALVVADLSDGDVGLAGFEKLYIDGATDGTNALVDPSDPDGLPVPSAPAVLHDTSQMVLSPHAAHRNADGSRRFLLVGTGQNALIDGANHAAVDAVNNVTGAAASDNREDPPRTGDRTRTIGPYPFRTDLNNDGVANTMGIFSGVNHGREGNELYELPVDADGDGINDSVLLDLDYPIIDLPDGRQVVPLFSFKIESLDGRLNVNAHGNTDGLLVEQLRAARADVASSATPATQLSAADLQDIFRDSANLLSRENVIASQLFGAQLGRIASISRSVAGVTPFEVNPTWAFTTVPSELNLDPNYDLLTGASGGFEEFDLNRFVFGRDYEMPLGGAPAATRNGNAGNANAGLDDTSYAAGRRRIAMANIELANLMLGRIASDGQVRIPGRYGEAGQDEVGTRRLGTDDDDRTAKLSPAAHAAGQTPGPGYSSQSLTSTGNTTASSAYTPVVTDRNAALFSYGLGSDDDYDGSTFIDDLRRRDAGMAYNSPFLGGTRIPGDVHPYPGRPTLEPFRETAPDGAASPSLRGKTLDLLTGPNVGTAATARVVPSQLGWPAYRSTLSTVSDTLQNTAFFFHPFSVYQTNAVTIASRFPFGASANPLFPGGTNNLSDLETPNNVTPWWALQRGALANVAGYNNGASVSTDTTLAVSQPVPSIDEPDELVLDPDFRDDQRDALFPPSELEGLMLSDQDFYSIGRRSRLRDLAPINFEASTQARENRSRFTTDSWDRLEHTLKPQFTTVVSGGTEVARAIRSWEFNNWAPAANAADSRDPINNFIAIRDGNGINAHDPTAPNNVPYLYRSGAGPYLEDCFPPQFGVPATGAVATDYAVAPVFGPNDPFRPEIRRLMMKFGRQAPIVYDGGANERLDNLPGGIENVKRIALGRKLELNGILADGIANDGTVLPAFNDWRLGSQNSPVGNIARLGESSEPNYRPLMPHVGFQTIPTGITTVALPDMIHAHNAAWPTVGGITYNLETYVNSSTTANNRRAIQEWHARYDRQRLARDIYVLLYTTCGPPDWDPTTEDPGANLSDNRNPQSTIDPTKRRLEVLVDEMAQFAVNLVDQMDSDSVITRFEYDRNLSNGWQWTATGGANAADAAITHGSGGLTAYPDSAIVDGIEDQSLTFSEGTFISTLKPNGDVDVDDLDNDRTPWDDEFQRQFLQLELRNVGAAPVEFAEGNWRILRLDEDATASSPLEVTAGVRLKHTASGAVLTVGPGENFTIASSDGADPAATIGTASPEGVGDIYIDIDGTSDSTFHSISSNENGVDVAGNPITLASATALSTNYNRPMSNLDLTYTGSATPVGVAGGQHSAFFDVAPYQVPSFRSSTPGIVSTNNNTILNTPQQRGAEEFLASDASKVTFVLQRRRALNQFNQFHAYPATVDVASLLAEEDWVEVDRMVLDVRKPMFSDQNDGSAEEIFAEIWGETIGGVTPQSTAPSNGMVSNYRIHPYAKDRTPEYVPPAFPAPGGPGSWDTDPTLFPRPHTYEEADDTRRSTTTGPPALVAVGEARHDTNNKDATLARGTLPTGVTIPDQFPWQPHFNRRLVSTSELLSTPLYGYRTYQVPTTGNTIDPHDFLNKSYDGTGVTEQHDVYGGPTANLVEPPSLNSTQNISPARVTPLSTATVRFQRPDGADDNYTVNQPPKLSAFPTEETVSQTDNHWYRLLGLIGLPDRTEQTLIDVRGPSSGDFRGGRDVRFARTRLAGKIDLNTITDQSVLAALLDDQADPAVLTAGTPAATGHFDYFNARDINFSVHRMMDDLMSPPTGTAAQTGNQAGGLGDSYTARGTARNWQGRNWWDEFRVSRDGWDDFTMLPIPGTFRSRPFQSTGAVVDDADPAYRDGLGVTRLHRRDVPDMTSLPDNTPFNGTGSTLPRIGQAAGRTAVPTVAPNIANMGLFESRAIADTDTRNGLNQQNNANEVGPWSRNRLLSKVLNNGTQRSHVFGMWVVVKFFEADHAPADRNSVRIGAEATDLPTFRSFAVVDMSRIEEAYVDKDPNDGQFGTFHFNRFILHRRRLD